MLHQYYEPWYIDPPQGPIGCYCCLKKRNWPSCLSLKERPPGFSTKTSQTTSLFRKTKQGQEATRTKTNQEKNACARSPVAAWFPNNNQPFPENKARGYKKQQGRKTTHELKVEQITLRAYFERVFRDWTAWNRQNCPRILTQCCSYTRYIYNSSLHCCALP